MRWGVLLIGLLLLAPAIAESPESEIKALQKAGARKILEGKAQAGLELLQSARDKAIAHYGEDSKEVAGYQRSLGISASMVGRFALAQEAFEQALATRLKSGSQAEQAEAHSDLAWVLRRVGRGEVALDHYQRSLKLRRKALGEEDPKTLGLYREIALTQDNLKRSAEALATCEQALKRLKPGYERTNLLLLAGEISVDQDQERAFRYLDAALEDGLATIGPRHGLVGTVLLTRAQFHLDAKRYQAARRELDHALKLSAECYDRGKPGDVWKGYALVANAEGQPEAALEAMEKALAAYRAAPGRRSDVMSTLYHLSELCAKLERYAVGRDYLLEAEKLATGADQVAVQKQLAVLANKSGDAKEHRLRLERALSLTRERRGLNHGATSDLMVQLAIAEFEDGLYGEAVDRLEVALGGMREHPELARGVGSILAILYALGDRDREARKLLADLGESSKPLYCTARGMVLFALEDWEEAAQQLEKGALNTDTMLANAYYKAGQFDKSWALLQARNGPDHPKWLMLEAQIREQRGDLAGAYQAFRRAMPLLEASPPSRLGVDLRGGYGVVAFKMFEETGQKSYLEEASLALRNSIEQLEQVRFRSNDERTGRQLSGSYQPLFAYAVEVELALGNPGSALELADRGMAQEMLRAAARAKVFESAGVDPKLRRQLAQVERELHTLEQQFAGLSPITTKPETLAPRLLELSSRREAFLKELASQVPAYQLLGQSAPARAADMQAKLAESEVAVLYYLADPHSFGFLVSPNEISSFRLPAKKAIESQVNRLSRSTARAGTRAVLLGEQPKLEDSTRADLGETLLGPLRGKIEGKSLLVVPTGQLLELPFELLPAPGGQSFLAQTHEVSYIPSLSILSHGDSGAQGSLLVGAPQYKKLPPLPFTRGEVEDTASRLKDSGLSCDVFLGGEASTDAMQSLAWEQYRYIHFATHGVLGRSPSLMLSADQPLSMSDIMGLPLKAELAVLSACKTGRGKVVPGEGVLGMSRAFLFAGARNVVVSLWSVDDASTAKLMDKFYEGLLERNETPRRALNQARRAMIAEGYQPRHWAPFILISQDGQN